VDEHPAAPVPPKTEPSEPADLQQADAVVPVTIGTALWAVALVVLLPFRSRLKDDGTDWWIWVAATGLVLGILGSLWVRRRRAAYRSTRPGS
jgi:hypothetical protein